LCSTRIDWFDDSLLETGRRWNEALLNRLGESDYGLLLVSFAFCASPFIINHELPLFVGPAALRGALPVALKPVPLDGTFDTHGVNAHLIFTIDGKAYSELTRDSHKDQFATELTRAIGARIRADTTPSEWRTL
jgi:hypothetical protein